MSRGGLQIQVFLIPLTETIFFKNLDQQPEKQAQEPIIGSWQALFFPQASEGKREADVGGRGTPHTRDLLVARRGNLGSNKVFQDGGRQWFSSTAFLVFPSLRFVAIVCLNFKARLSFFRCSTCLFGSLLILYMAFLHSYLVYASGSKLFIFHKNTKLSS